MRTTQTGAPPPRRPTRPLASSSRRQGGSGGPQRPSPFPRTDTPTYNPVRFLGKGSFGVVLLAEDAQTGEKVAIKRVRYDPRLHNREIAILNSVLVDHKSSGKLNVTPRSQVSGAVASPFAAQTEEKDEEADREEESVHEWAGAHHPNIVELKDSYVTYDDPAVEADEAAAAAFHAHMGGAGLGHHDSELLAQLLQTRYPMSGSGRPTAASPAYAYLEMVMSFLPMDLSAMKRHFYHHHRMPSAALASAEPPNATQTETSGDREGREPLQASGRPAGPSIGARLPLRWVKIFLFQLARALTFMHAHHVCHRDLKPANVLVDPDTGRLQVCDFGSAKQILHPANEKNVSYICSRYYRAPELLFGALHYGCEVDMWSFGCLLAELLRESGRPLFRGCTSVDQMAELFKVMGAPSKREMYAMNPQCAEALLRTHAMHKPGTLAGNGFGTQAEMGDDSDLLGGGHARHDGFLDDDEEAQEDQEYGMGGVHTTPAAASASALPSQASSSSHYGDGDTSVTGETPAPFGDYYDVLKVRAIPWRALFPVDTPNEAVALATALLCYTPQKRLSALEVVEHAFFDDLFAPALEDGATPSHMSDSAPTASPADDEDAALRMPNGRLMPLEMFQVTAIERDLFTDAFLAKMARQAKRITAARKREARRSSSS